MKKITKYQAVKNYILTRIKSGEYLPGRRIPNEKELSEALGVSSITVRKAMSELAGEGLITRIKGKGSYISQPAESGGDAAPAGRLIAFLLSCQDINDSSLMKIMIGIQRCLSTEGYSLIVENPGDDPVKELQIIKRLMENQVAGFIIFSANPELSLENYVYLRSRNIPFVLIDRWAENFPSNSVACNNHDGAYSAIEYLIGLKHKRIGFAFDKPYLSSEKERYEGYCDAMRFASLKTDSSMLFKNEAADFARMKNAIKNREITAVFAVNDLRGLGLVNQLTDQGIRIPEDVSVMGFDDYETSRMAKVSLSTVRQHFEEEGYYSARLLLDIMAGSQLQYSRILIGTQLVIRSSTGSPQP